MKELKRLRKLTTLTSLPWLDGKRRRKDDALPLLPSGDDTQFDVTDDEERRLANVLKDDALARRILSLRKSKYPYGTVPELLMVDYLESENERYKYQAQLFGGWRSGGLVPDFVVSQSGSSTALLINGTYWHQVPGKREKDEADKRRLMNTYFDGERIDNVVVVWEDRLMGPDRKAVMQAAVQGQELGR